MLKKDMPKGVILYEGPSLIDGQPIVVIANGFKNHKNRKIGDMIQTWILRSDMHPHNALQQGADYSICGDCLHRGVYDGKAVRNRTCYVNLLKQGVFHVYNAYKRGAYPKVNLETLNLFDGRHVRIGSYGDPAAVPVYVWDIISKVAKNHTGYTHQWKTCDSGYKKFCMASVDTEQEYELANKMGWRTFRIRCSENSPLLDNEIVCPAQLHKTQCERCGFCDGAFSNRKNACIVVHGQDGRPEAFERKILALNSTE